MQALNCSRFHIATRQSGTFWASGERPGKEPTFSTESTKNGRSIVQGAAHKLWNSSRGAICQMAMRTYFAGHTPIGHVGRFDARNE